MTKYIARLLTLLIAILPNDALAIPKDDEAISHGRNLSWFSWAPDIEMFGILTCAVDGQTVPIGIDLSMIIVSHPQPTAHGIWSYLPTCYHRLGISEEPLCVYTNKHFNNNQGISFITTPSIAKTLTDLSASIPSNRTQISQYNSSQQDKGLRAAQPIKKGQEILANYAVLVTHPSFWDMNLSWQQKEELLRIAVLQLAPPMQKAIINLSARPGESSHYLSYILWSHGGWYRELLNAKHNLLFPEMSLLNHDCAPNSHNRADEVPFRGSIIAARNIEEGEPITISYWVDNHPQMHLLPYNDRQQYSESTGFRCKCARCKQGAIKDSILELLVEQQDFLEQRRNSSFTSAADLRRAFRLLQLYRELKLDVLLHFPYELIARTYSAMSRHKLAEIWLGKAKDILALNGIKGS